MFSGSLTYWRHNIVFDALEKWWVSLVVSWPQTYVCQNDFFQTIIVPHRQPLLPHRMKSSLYRRPKYRRVYLPAWYLHGVPKTGPELVAITSSNLNRFSNFFRQIFDISSGERILKIDYYLPNQHCIGQIIIKSVCVCVSVSESVSLSHETSWTLYRSQSQSSIDLHEM